MYATAIGLIAVSLLGVLLTLADLVIGSRLYESASYRWFVTLAGIAFNVALILFVLVVARRIWALERLTKGFRQSEN